MFDYLTKTLIINLKQFTMNVVQIVLVENQIFLFNHKNTVYTVFSEHKPLREI